MVQTIHLLNKIVLTSIRRFVFASSAAAKFPASPYARSKRFIEDVLPDYARAYGIQGIALRLFNVGGGDFSERHVPETHLLPRLVDAAILGTTFDLYGHTHPTPDGTCVRDYVSASDVADACVRSLSAPFVSTPILDVGCGVGHSVRQVLSIVEDVVGRPVHVRVAPRREGDLPTLIAKVDDAFRLLGWTPKRSGLVQLVRETVTARSRPYA